MFQNIVSVDKEEHVITISENPNAVLDEVGRWVPLVRTLRTVAPANVWATYDTAAHHTRLTVLTEKRETTAALWVYTSTLLNHGVLRTMNGGDLATAFLLVPSPTLFFLVGHAI